MSRKLITLFLGAAAISAAPAAAQPGARLSPEAELERALEGRVAGRPVDCIDLRSVGSSRVIDRTAIIYGRGSTIYVNRPRSGASSLSRHDAAILRTISNRLCSIDTLQMVDTGTGVQTGLVFLGEFVPYRRVSRGD